MQFIKNDFSIPVILYPNCSKILTTFPSKGHQMLRKIMIFHQYIAITHKRHKMCA